MDSVNTETLVLSTAAGPSRSFRKMLWKWEAAKHQGSFGPQISPRWTYLYCKRRQLI